MNSHFYTRLREGGFAAVQKWTRRIDLFSHDVCLIPVHLGVHWTCAVIDFTAKTVHYYDSLHGRPPGFAKTMLDYLVAEHQDKKGVPLPDASEWQVNHDQTCPIQHNGYDCGVFSCLSAERASRRAPLDHRQADMNYYRDRISIEILDQKLLPYY